MLAININNPEIENRIKKYAMQNKKVIEDLASDALRIFLDMKKDDKLIYTRKDPMKYFHTIEYTYYDSEDLSDVKLYSHIHDVACYVHNLRKVREK